MINSNILLDETNALPFNVSESNNIILDVFNSLLSELKAKIHEENINHSPETQNSSISETRYNKNGTSSTLFENIKENEKLYCTISKYLSTHEVDHVNLILKHALSFINDMKNEYVSTFVSV